MNRRIARRRLRRRLAAVLIGLVAVVVLVEILLRVMAAWLDVTVYQPRREVRDNFDVMILCTGDSHTEGIGAPPGRGYPEQLEAKLNDVDRSRRYRVVNLGRAGDNSSEAVDRALEFLRATPRQPDAIVFNAGKNNDHNLRHARIFPEIEDTNDYRVWAKHLLSNSRAVRLSQLTWSRLEALAEDDQADRPMKDNSFLRRRGVAEKRLLTDWVAKDIDALVAAAPGRVALLSYWMAVDWVDRAFAEAAARHDLPVVDAHNFGGAVPLALVPFSGLSNSELGGHPAAPGYALIADLVHETLAARGLLPDPAAAPPAQSR